MNSQRKIIVLKTLLKKLSTLRQEGKIIAFTNGCFDILHAGHVQYLESARKVGRILILGLNSDKSIRKIKSPPRPYISDQQRAIIMAGLSSIDYVVMFDEDTPTKLITAIKPDVLIKGADYIGKPIAGEDVVRRYGGKIELIKFVEGISTSNIIEKILNLNTRS